MKELQSCDHILKVFQRFMQVFVLLVAPSGSGRTQAGVWIETWPPSDLTGD